MSGAIGSEATIPAGTINTSQSFTISTFFNPVSVSSQQTILDVDGNSVGSVYLQIQGGKVKVVMFAADSPASQITVVSSSVSISPNLFTQAAISYDTATSKVTLYVNGSNQGSADVSSAFQAGGVVGIGRGLYNGQRVDPFAGTISDVGLQQTASSDQRVLEYAATNEIRYGEGTGTSAADSSGYGNNQTLTGGASWMIGKQYPTALALNGNTSEYSTGPESINTAASYSVSAWVYANDPNRQQTAVAINGTQVSKIYLQVSNGSFCLCGFSADSAGSHFYAAKSTDAVKAATWYHLTGVFDASAQTMSLYVNGTLARTVSLPAQWSATGALVVGQGLYAGNPVDPWNGGVEDVRLYPVALSASAAASLATASYNACNDPSLPPEVGTSEQIPSDPSGYGYANETQLGYTGNQYAPITSQRILLGSRSSEQVRRVHLA